MNSPEILYRTDFGSVHLYIIVGDAGLTELQLSLFGDLNRSFWNFNTGIASPCP